MFTKVSKWGLEKDKGGGGATVLYDSISMVAQQ